MSSSALMSKSPAGSQTSKDWNSKILNLNHQSVKRELERWFKWVRELDALPEVLNFILSIPVGQLTIACDTNSLDSNALF